MKPPYHVPSMADIAAVRPNGYTVVSTFSGCGGSCLGFKMEGFKVLWASEFIPAAQDTYIANHPDTHLDTRDIRQVRAADIRTVIGTAEVDVLEGSPPCASFSTAGKREEGWGHVKAYSDTKQRVDDLFFEFVRILGELRPKIFVAENVSGLVKGTAKGYFLAILAAMKDAGYLVKCKLLDAQWLGVPQARQRTIFIGVREDLGRDPVHPKPLPYRYSVRDAIPWIVDINGRTGPHFARVRSEINAPMNAIIVNDPAQTRYEVEAATDISRFAIGREAVHIAEGGKSEKYLNLCRAHRDRPCPTITACGSTISAAAVIHPTEKRKFSIAELKRICGFPDDFILTGTYNQQWERLGRAVPPVMMAAVAREVRRVLDDCRN